MGDSASFDQFYRGTHKRVLTYLYAVSGDLTSAQDLTQEAYARAWQRWSRISRYEDPEAWVRTVGWRLASNRWRAAARWLSARRRLGPPEPVPGPSAEHIALTRALQQLPAAQRAAIVLHHLYGMPVGEIAAELGTPEGTVKARLSRGRAALAALLSEKQEETAHA
ncbi:RNA polymerase sigma factor [Longispora albida]|uniref:RNA polymerase sigma factor n=1 Tax=Longispora albida TaxID=203523 RepID=UPI0003620636|nr:SigE family RNA polymerase sigma factor [Longispora albida]